MTVSAMIALLQQHDGDAEVTIRLGNLCHLITDVRSPLNDDKVVILSQPRDRRYIAEVVAHGHTIERKLGYFE